LYGNSVLCAIVEKWRKFLLSDKVKHGVCPHMCEKSALKIHSFLLGIHNCTQSYDIMWIIITTVTLAKSGFCFSIVIDIVEMDAAAFYG